MSQLLFRWRSWIVKYTKRTNLGPSWALARTPSHLARHEPLGPKCRVAMHAWSCAHSYVTRQSAVHVCGCVRLLLRMLGVAHIRTWHNNHSHSHSHSHSHNRSHCHGHSHGHSHSLSHSHSHSQSHSHSHRHSHSHSHSHRHRRNQNRLQYIRIECYNKIL